MILYSYIRKSQLCISIGVKSDVSAAAVQIYQLAKNLLRSQISAGNAIVQSDDANA